MIQRNWVENIIESYWSMAPRNPVCCSIKIQLRYAENFNYNSSYFSLDFIFRYFLWDSRNKKHKPYAIDWFLINYKNIHWVMKQIEIRKGKSYNILKMHIRSFGCLIKTEHHLLSFPFITEIVFVSHSHSFP